MTAQAFEWRPERWWRVKRGSILWCETSDEAEARAKTQPGDELQRLWKRQQFEWRSSDGGEAS